MSTKYRTTVYIELEDKKRLEALSEETLIPEARLWREALRLLFEKRLPSTKETRREALKVLRTSLRKHKIRQAYESYKEEEKRLEQKRGR